MKIKKFLSTVVAAITLISMLIPNMVAYANTSEAKFFGGGY